MFQSLMDEMMAALSRRSQISIVIENKFSIDKESIENYLLLIPSIESIEIIVSSIEQAKMAYYR